MKHLYVDADARTSFDWLSYTDLVVHQPGCVLPAEGDILWLIRRIEERNRWSLGPPRVVVSVEETGDAFDIQTEAASCQGPSSLDPTDPILDGWVPTLSVYPRAVPRAVVAAATLRWRQNA